MHVKTLEHKISLGGSVWLKLCCVTIHALMDLKILPDGTKSCGYLSFSSLGVKVSREVFLTSY